MRRSDAVHLTLVETRRVLEQAQHRPRDGPPLDITLAELVRLLDAGLTPLQINWLIYTRRRLEYAYKFHC